MKKLLNTNYRLIKKLFNEYNSKSNPEVKYYFKKEQDMFVKEYIDLGGKRNIDKFIIKENV